MRGQQIKELLEKYFNGTLNMEEEQLLDEWYFTLGGADEIHLSSRAIAELKERIWKEVSAKTIGAEPSDHSF